MLIGASISQIHTRHLNTKLRRDALRLGNLSAAQRSFWIQYHYKKTGIDGPYSRIFGSRGIWAGIIMMGHWRESWVSGYLRTNSSVGDPYIFRVFCGF